MSDPIDVALDAIADALDKCASNGVDLISLGQTFANDSGQYRRFFISEGELLWVMFGGVKDVTDIALSMTHDVQVTLSENYLHQALTDQAVEPIEWSAENFNFKATPVARQNILTNPGPSYRKGHAALVIEWKIEVNGITTERLISFLEFRLDIHSAWPKLTLIPSRWLRFYDATGVERDALNQVPYSNGSRAKARLDISHQMSIACRDFSFQVSILSQIPLPMHLEPLASFAGDAAVLVFKVNGLPLRRAPYELSAQSPVNPENVHLRIKSNVLVDKLVESIRQIPDANLHDARFDGRYFRFTVHIYKKERECIAEARIHAWVDYYAQIRTSGKTILNFEAQQLGWKAKWEVDWCFHRCDEANDKIKSTLENTIPTYSQRTVPIGQFSSFAHRTRGWMDAFGLNIMLEAIQ